VTTPDPVVRVTNDEFASNTYLVRTATPGECVLIDPGLDRTAIDTALDETGLVPIAIFATHGHFDHIGSAEHYRRRFSVPVHLHAADKSVALKSNFMMMAFRMRTRIDVPEAFVALEDGFAWTNGPDRVTAIHVPGHTPGSTILDVNGRLFSGDTIYRGEVWLTALPEGDRPLLIESVRAVWDLLPESAPVHPGHGGSASFGDIKTSNAPLREMLGLVGAPTNG
jgi:glyoxylase-like metal-dependent hydrolase (beta-lactamase superfamily II)